MRALVVTTQLNSWINIIISTTGFWQATLYQTPLEYASFKQFYSTLEAEFWHATLFPTHCTINEEKIGLPKNLSCNFAFILI